MRKRIRLIIGIGAPLLVVLSAVTYVAFGTFTIALGPPLRATSFAVPTHYFLGQPLWYFRALLHREERSTLRINLRADGQAAFPIHGLDFADKAATFEIWVDVEHSLASYHDSILRALAKDQITPETVASESVASQGGLLAVSLDGKTIGNTELYVLYVGKPLHSDYLTAILCPARQSPVIVCTAHIYNRNGYSLKVSFPPERLPQWEGIARSRRKLDAWQIKER
jgi:hypothetical protein